MSNNYIHNMFPGGPIPVDEEVAPSGNRDLTEQIKKLTNNSDGFYINNLLTKNKNRMATFYLSYPSSVDWRDQKISGVIKGIGNDFVVVYDRKQDQHCMLMLMYLNYITFHDEVNY